MFLYQTKWWTNGRGILSKRKTLDSDPKVPRTSRKCNKILHSWRLKKNIFCFSQEKVRVLWNAKVTWVTLTLSPNMIGSSNDETNFYHKLLLKNRQVPNIPKAFAKNSATSAVPASANMKLLNSQISKITQ